MNILDFNTFNERFDIDKINIKDVDLNNVKTAVHIFPKPDKSLKDSLEDGMICIVSFLSGEKRPHAVVVVKKDNEFYLENNARLIDLNRYDQDMREDAGTTFERAIIAVYAPINGINKNTHEADIKSIIKDKTPIWTKIEK